MTHKRADRGPAPAFEDLQAADDRALVDAFRNGRREAFDLLVERHQRHVFQLCYRFAGTREDALDLAQDVFVRAFRGLARFKGEAAVSTWLYRVAVNVCLNHAAVRRVATQPLISAEYEDRRGPDALSAIVRAESAAALREAIRQLPPKQRATLILRIYHDLPHEQIARILGSSVGAAKANFFHALGNLRRAIKS